MASSKKPLWRLITLLWGDWQSNALWQRIVKCSIACVVAVIIAILPSLRNNAMFLTPMVTVFAHPGQRMGAMVEALLLILFGSLLGLCWSLFGLYLASLAAKTDEPAAYTIRGLFLLVSVLLHGYIRSSSPRLFNFVLFMLIAAVLTLGLPNEATKTLFMTIYVPVLLGGAVLLGTSFLIFPESSSSYLGSSTIDAFSEAMATLEQATYWFITPGGDPTPTNIGKNTLNPTVSGSSAKTKSSVTSRGRRIDYSNIRKFLNEFPNPFGSDRKRKQRLSPHLTTLANLTEKKSKIRNRLRICKAAQEEVNFELSASSLPPDIMKPISTHCMTDLVQSTVTVLSCCESKFVLLGTDKSSKRDVDVGKGLGSNTSEQSGASRSKNRLGKTKDEKEHKKFQKIRGVQPIREIEAGSAELLESILGHIREPVQAFEAALKEAEILVTSCIAYCFDVKTLPSGALAPSGILLEEIDIGVDALVDALQLFDSSSAEQLKHAVLSEMGQSLDFMPRMETFLVSSFLLSFRHAGTQVVRMLRHTRDLVERRQQESTRFRIWLPRYSSLENWLSSGGQSYIKVIPAKKKKKNSQDKDAGVASLLKVPDPDTISGLRSQENGDQKQTIIEQGNVNRQPGTQEMKTNCHNIVSILRNTAADTLEWLKQSEHVDYSIKLAIAVFLVSWPALVTSWSSWYHEVRGLWAPLQLILVFELAIGTSFFVFFIRLFGVVFGCVVGYAAYEIGRGNRAAMVVVLLFGMIPSIYIQLATKYVKAGMISTVSMAVVALAAANRESPAYEVFYKRLVAFLIGGLVSVVVEVLITPVRARDRLVDSLSTSIRQIQKMQSAVSVGVNGPERPNMRSPELLRRFNRARDKAQIALANAEMFLPFCLTEPRLKGSFKPLAPIYSEMIYVLHQIIDRMGNIIKLRNVYGSSILEDLNPKVYAYRRNVAASSIFILFSVNEALHSWLPLPQFIPSARLAQIRLINRIREILCSTNLSGQQIGHHYHFAATPGIDEETATQITQHKFLSWNASTAGQMEVIEYLEELVDLVKILVGVNAFRSGMLERPNYRQYVREVTAKEAPYQDESGALEGEQGGRGNESLVNLGRSATVGRRRAATLTGHVERLRAWSRGDELTADYDSNEEEAGEEERIEVPTSLQRVGTRLREDNSAVRRRAFTVGG